jgi:hypothetical protein
MGPSHLKSEFSDKVTGGASVKDKGYLLERLHVDVTMHI